MEFYGVFDVFSMNVLFNKYEQGPLTVVMGITVYRCLYF